MGVADSFPAALYAPFLPSASPMSSSVTQVTQADITALKLTFTNTACQLAAATMIFHEHTVTIAQEIRYVWGTRLTGATIIFLLNRYMVLILGITIVLQTVAWDTPLSCEATIMLYDVVSILLYIIIAVFSALRAFAIGGRRWSIASVILGLGLAIAIASIYFAAKSSNAYVLIIDDMPVCNYTDYYSVQSYDESLIATRLCAILADALLIGLTLYTTLRTRRVINPRTRTPLTTQLARDGSLYFVSLLFLNVLQMALKSVNGAITNFVSVFVAPISSILISRFMLNLRHVFYLQSKGWSTSMIGNMGELLDHHWYSGTSTDFRAASNSLLSSTLSGSETLSLDIPIADRISDDIELHVVR
ncbi:uncharacterized protein C8Q71DRAFT_750405 [Rhodofomes roseus]|uniref:DUF6533 domain-containing protein n=1 Tax=Rhodofomes roseus TaxID=34475 RepID=A0ABQ8KJQ4_9APHY|nr:uncharacterized protein C8Q71DRAFT_750405 [Rhodofomes roseus]KAH9838311.1 hypothetical protein C8Q71DRAFT_750405 [Rhodofomes roseus]